eukprot:132069-Alexandrium_andersonii.AAC.1
MTFISSWPAPGPRANPSAKMLIGAEGFVPWYTFWRSSKELATSPPAPKASVGTHSGSGLPALRLQT